MPSPLAHPPIRTVGAPKSDWPESPQWHDGRFHNRLAAEAGASPTGSMLKDLATKGSKGKPARPVPLVTPTFGPAAGLAATWIGHASVLVEIAGTRILTDPVFGERVSPFRQIGPKRLHATPITLADLPTIDVALISHDHYDHLDEPTVIWLANHQDTTFVVPLGVAAHLRSWGIASTRIVELDWDGRAEVAGLTFTCCETRHFSGRWLSRDTTLWASWAIEADGTRVFFGGDTGYFPALADIGADHGPFDLTLLPMGAYDPRWRDIHMDPGEALVAHADLRGDVLLPIHWATFDLAFHRWAEPIERLVAEAEPGVRITTPRPGERVLPDVLPNDRWWR